MPETQVRHRIQDTRRIGYATAVDIGISYLADTGPRITGRYRLKGTGIGYKSAEIA